LYARYSPFSQLLPQCAALVHHGGIGSCAQALAAGIPQIIQPCAHDQFENARCVQALGAGEHLKRNAALPAITAALLRCAQGLRSPALASCQQRMHNAQMADLCSQLEAPL
jgi:rhamnosyltransferase subunit B